MHQDYKLHRTVVLHGGGDPLHSIYDDFNPGPVDPDFCEKVEERMNEYGMHRPVCGIGPEIEVDEEEYYNKYVAIGLEYEEELHRARCEGNGYILGDVIYPTKEAYDKACDEFAEWMGNKRRLLEEEDFDNLFNGGNCKYTLPLDEYDYPEGDSDYEYPADCSDPCSVPHDMVNLPPHYRAHPSGIECIQITEHMNFCLGNAVKYVWRAGLKGGSEIEDLKKAVWYINREIERLNKEVE